MRYAAIVAQVGVFAVAFMCRVLEVAPSGYYAWLERSPSKKSVRDGALLVHVRAAFVASRRRYGSPRVHADLSAGGHHVGRKRVARLMRESHSGFDCAVSTAHHDDFLVDVVICLDQPVHNLG